MNNHRMLMAWSAALLVCASASSSARAETYRCTMPADSSSGGHTEVRYQAEPCDGGQVMRTLDRRTDAQRMASSRNIQTEAKLGRKMERERRHQERQSPNRPTAMDAPKPQDPPGSGKPSGQFSTVLKRERFLIAKVNKRKPATTSATTAKSGV
jgi:hypothetical protein